MCLFEGTNVSEGRGTTRPFEFFGAPWIDGVKLTSYLNQAGLPGVHFREAAFEPGFQKFQGEVCRGCQIHVKDRESFQPVRTALAILAHLQETCESEFRWKDPPYNKSAFHKAKARSKAPGVNANLADGGGGCGLYW